MKMKASEIPVVDTKELAVVKTQASKATDYANTLTVTNDDDYKLALEDGKRIKETLDKVQTRREEITKPLNDALKSARALFKPIEESLQSALDMIRTKMTVYHKAKLGAAQKAEQIITEKVENGKMKTETAMKKMDEIDRPDKTTSSESAKATMRTVIKYRITDKGQIPLEFMEPNMTAIKASFRAGKPVSGVEAYEEQELAIS